MPYRDKKFSELLVADVYDKLVLKASQVKSGAMIYDAIEQMISNMSRKAYVVDEEGRYLGTISTETILKLIGYRVGVRDSSSLSFYRFLRDIFKEDVNSIMAKGRTVTKETPLTKALKIMLDDHLNDLPVVDENNRLIGELVSLELFIEGKKVFMERDEGSS
ncbi:MAG: CBS domain-containing protein [Methanomassiliicoccales archaeon]|nr:MAG: CBS domain-containing protein [Methanomassiliicoccales archaeon]